MTMHRLSLALVLLAACSSDSSDPGPADAPTSTGAPATSFDWTIKMSGLPATCASAHANEVRITATAENGVPTPHTFQCVLTPGSLDLPAGRYAIVGQLYDGTGPQKFAETAPQAVTVPASGTPASVQFAFSF